MSDDESTQALQELPRAHTLTVRQSVRSSRLFDSVFEAILDQTSLPKFTKWHGVIPPVKKVDVHPNAPLRVGSRRHLHFAIGGGYTEVIEALEQGPNACSMQYRVIGGFPPPISWFARGAIGRYEVERSPDGCIAMWTAWVELRSALVIPFARAFGTLFVHSAMRGYLLAVTKA